MTDSPGASTSPPQLGPHLWALTEALKRGARRLRWLMLGFLLLLMQWPLSQIDGLVRQREQRRSEAPAEVTLRSEDHALLTGAVGLLVLLGCVMYVTRRLNRPDQAIRAA
jgi:inner membrane protein involved in colicin E2 resistance